MNRQKVFDFYKGKRVFITGHTGFKGAWLCRILTLAGADVTGYSLEPPTTPSLFALTGIEEEVHSITGDVRNLDSLSRSMQEAKPDLIFHLAAQPIVRESYRDPVGTYSSNVMGTVNVLESLRHSESVRSFLNVTTDKVYENKEWLWGYRENEPLDGYDPYSNSKSCSELVTHSYRKSFFSDSQVAISTARAGNVVGGGDFAPDRILPDCLRAVEKQQDIAVRNPYSTRPYQHVLEPLFCYLMIAMKQFEDIRYADSYNVGPDDCDCVTTGELADLFCNAYNRIAEDRKISWKNQSEANAPHEANFLKLDCSKLKSTFGWNPRWHIAECIEKVVEWDDGYLRKGNINEIENKQIEEFFSE